MSGDTFSLFGNFPSLKSSVIISIRLLRSSESAVDFVANSILLYSSLRSLILCSANSRAVLQQRALILICAKWFELEKSTLRQIVRYLNRRHTIDKVNTQQNIRAHSCSRGSFLDYFYDAENNGNCVESL